jgi:PhnB protein
MSQQPNVPLIQPYLFFNGRCEEAIEFYRRAIGAEVFMMMRFDEAPDPPPPGMVPPVGKRR